MKKYLFIIPFIVILFSCNDNVSKADPPLNNNLNVIDYTSIEWATVTVVHDNLRHVTCWVTGTYVYGGSASSISCLPDPK